MNLRRAGWVLALCWPLAADAAVVVEFPQVPDCLAHKTNAAVVIKLPAEPPVAQSRLYFRRETHGDYNRTEFERQDKDDDGRDTAWALFPKPDNENRSVEYYVDLRDADGKSIAVSEQKLVPVEDDCDVDLSGEQRSAGNKLTVGETTPDQRGKGVAWFICDGITQRISSDGKRRPDQFCGIPPSPFPVAGRDESGVIIDPKPPFPVSPSRPERPR